MNFVISVIFVKNFGIKNIIYKNILNFFCYKNPLPRHTGQQKTFSNAPVPGTVPQQ